MTKANTVMSDDPDIIHLATRVDRVETDVTEIKAGVKALLDRPQNPGFTQVIGTLLSTLGACALIFGFAEWRLEKAVKPIETAFYQSHEITLQNRVDFAVLEERIAWVKSLQNWKPTP